MKTLSLIMSAENATPNTGTAPLPTRLALPLLLVAAWVTVVSLHCSVLAPYFELGPAVIGDEILYRLYADRLLHFEPYLACTINSLCSGMPDPNYPPAYPLLLALAEWVSPAAPLETMKIVNIGVASAVMFPIYALARQLLSRDLAFGAAIVAGMLPAGFVFTLSLMSENLYTTVFVTVFWLAVRQRPASLVVAALFGGGLALCFLTKFISLPTIPLLAARGGSGET